MTVIDDFNGNNISTSAGEEERPPLTRRERSRHPSSQARYNFLSLTAGQWFVISLLLLFLVCELGTFCLILSGKMVIPFP
jgi:hypothetical protein